jgi:hypothetical protein
MARVSMLADSAGAGARSPNDRFVLRRPKGLSVETEDDVLSNSSTPTRTSSSEGAHRDKQARGSDVLRWRASSEQFKVAPSSDLRAVQQNRPIPVLEGKTHPTPASAHRTRLPADS